MPRSRDRSMSPPRHDQPYRRDIVPARRRSVGYIEPYEGREVYVVHHHYCNLL